MLTRVAIFEGSIKAGGEDAFFDQVRERRTASRNSNLAKRGEL